MQDNLMAKLMDVPVPGQSLTKTPGGYPWEKPPQFTDPEKAFVSVLNAMTDKKTAPKIVGLMELGVPVKVLSKTLLMTGFIEGKWTVDMMVILAEPVTMLLIKLAKEAGVKAKIDYPEPPDPLEEQLIAHRMGQQPPAPPPIEEPPGMPLPSGGGFMEPMMEEPPLG